MILQVITYILGVIGLNVTNIDALLIDEYVSWLDMWIMYMTVAIIILIVSGVIRHNGNSG